jgi:hypothetical protein
MRAYELLTEAVKQRLDPKCWKGYKKQGTKVKDGVRVNNCVKERELSFLLFFHRKILFFFRFLEFANAIFVSNVSGNPRISSCRGVSSDYGGCRYI